MKIKQSRPLEIYHKSNDHQSLRIQIPAASLRTNTFPGMVLGLVEEKKMIKYEFSFVKRVK